MSLGYVVRPSADRDIDSIADDLVDRGGLDLGLRFLKTAYETFALVASQPRMGWFCRLSNPALLECRVFRVGEPFSKYLFYYRPLPVQIEIVRVLHGSQDIEERLADEGG